MTALERRAGRLMYAQASAPAPEPVTTAQIAATLRRVTDGRLNHAVENARPLVLPDADLPVPPYAMGVWLGEGHGAGAGYTSDDPEIAAYIETDRLVATRQTRRTYAVSIGDGPGGRRSRSAGHSWLA